MARRSGLGRGLDALIPGASVEAAEEAAQEAAASTPAVARDVLAPREGAAGSGPSDADRSRLVTLAIGEIRPNRYQPRVAFDEASLDGLAESIAAIGVLQPVLVRPSGDGYELVAGERRWRAARKAGLTRIPAIVRHGEDQSALEEAIVENLHRQDLNPLEEAAGLKQLIEDFGLTQDETARRVGRSRPAVSNLLRLLTLPAEIQRLVREGSVGAGHARALLSLESEVERIATARRIAQEGLSVRAVEELVRARDEIAAKVPSAGRSAGSRARPDRTEPRSTERPAGVLELEELLSDRLNTRVEVDMRSARGRIVIEFADLDDLERLYRIITGHAP